VNRRDRIYIAGHRGMVGSALVRRLRSEGAAEIITRTRQQLDLTDFEAVRRFFDEQRPEYVFIAAAKVGGIHANETFPVEFLVDNLAIELNVVRAAHEYDVKKLMLLGSSCAYPKHAPQPISEDALLSGSLDATNEWYAIAKIAGIKLCQAYRKQFGADFISVMPTNLYGPGDNYDLQTSHVLAALIRRFHDARAANAPRVVLWGSGAPRREFLHVDDLADACVHIMRTYTAAEPLNIGWGKDISIAELAELVRGIVGYRGEITWDRTMPDGTPRKLLDSSRLAALGWIPRIPLREGVAAVYACYREEAPLPAGGLARGGYPMTSERAAEH
jgi:GDP-L-fucose synthase